MQVSSAAGFGTWWLLAIFFEMAAVERTVERDLPNFVHACHRCLLSTQPANLPADLEQLRVDDVRRELILGMRNLSIAVRRLYLCLSVVRWFTCLVIATSMLMLADMIFQWNEAGLRLLASGTWMAVAVGTAFWMLVPAWRFSPTNAELAEHIERVSQYPGFAAAMEISTTAKDEWRFGAPEFRDAFLVDWRQRHARFDWAAWPNRREIGIAGCILLLVLGCVAAMWMIWPVDSRFALTRLAMPWSTVRWPRENNLRILNVPEIVVRGSSVEIEVVDDRGLLPKQIDLLIRRSSSASSSEPSIERHPMRILRTLAVTTLASVDQAIEVRAVGGDDTEMPWRKINVGTIPELAEPTFHVQPPEYVEAPLKSLVGTQVEVLAESRVRFTANFLESVRYVDVIPRLNESPARENPASSPSLPNELQPASELQPTSSSVENAPTWTATLDESGKHLTLHGTGGRPLIASNSMRWQLLVTTHGGLEVTHAADWSLQVRSDLPPVVLLRPLESAIVSPQSSIQLHGQATDDLALDRFSANWELQDTQPTQAGTIPLWSAENAQPDSSASVVRVSEESRKAEVNWQLALDHHLAPASGQKYKIWLEARDNRGQISRSQPQVISVGSTEDVVLELQNEQSKIFAQLKQLLELQRRNVQLAERTDAAVRQSNSVRPEDVDTLSGMAQLQQSIQQGLTAESSSVLAEIDRLLARVNLHQLENSEPARQLSKLRESIRSEASRSVTAAAQASKDIAAKARQTGNQPRMAASEVAEMTAQLAAGFQAATSDLQSLTQQLSHSESVRELQRDLVQVLDRQQQLRGDLSQLEIAQSINSPSSDIEASKAGLRSDQQGLARTLDEVLANAKALVNQPSNEAPELTESVESARQSIVRKQLSQAMREAAEKINQDQFSDAASIQQRIADSLRQSLRQMNPSASDSLEDLLTDTMQATEKLGELANQQQQLAETMSLNSSSNRSAMASQQAELKLQTERVAAQLARQGNTSEAELTQAAIDSQQTAGQAAQDGNMKAASDAARNAAEHLDRAAQTSTERAQQLAKELAQQQMFQLDTALNQLAQQQSTIVDDIEKIPPKPSKSESQKDDSDRVIPDEGSSAQVLIIRQEAVRQMVNEVRNRTDQLAAFDWVLAETDSDMQRTVAAMQRNLLRPDAQRSARSALRKLQLAMQAIGKEPASTKAPSNPEEDPREKDSPQNDSQKQLSPPIASLKLLRAVQQDINHETQQFDAESKLLDPIDRKARLGELSEQQRALSEQMQELLDQIQEQHVQELVP